MIPKLYRADNTTGTSRTFLGNINHCSRGICKEVLNGEYIAEFTTDLNDYTAGWLKTQRLFEARPNFQDPPQLFIINRTERLINGQINVYGEHIKTLCNQYTTRGESVYSDENETILENYTPLQIWNYLRDNCFLDTPPFSFSSTITTKNNFSLGITKAETLGNILGGTEGSLLDKFRGEYHFDNFSIQYKRNRGTTKLFSLRYGRNISDAKQTEETSSLYTHILPFGSVKDGATGRDLVLSGNLTAIPNSESEFRKTFLYDCSEKSKNLTVYSNSIEGHYAGEGYPEAREKMSQFALSYAKSQKLGSTLVSINVTHRSELDEMRSINIGDSISVVLDNFGTATTARIVEGEFDFLNERWNSLVVGEQKPTLGSLFLNYSKYINNGK